MESENKLFPGRENYTGPITGYFVLLHHDRLFEHSHNVMERVAHIKRGKPAREIATRLHNMLYLPFVTASYFADYKAKCATLYADYKARRAPLDADYKAGRAPLYADYKARRAPLDADYEARCDTLDAEILTYIRSHIPDCAWDEKKGQLEFK